MARKKRIEYPGAVYHVISRGNYRKDLFTIGRSGASFEKTLFEVVERCGWNLHAYVIMSNHYHLVLELEKENLVDGMKWLQSTFANRFNRFTKETGHVFQGRYKAILIEPDRPLLGVVNYVHLNPVRAGIVGIEALKTYNLSSFPKLFRRKPPLGLCRARFLSMLGFVDSIYGMKRYHEYLAVCEESDPGKKVDLRKQYSEGWIVASNAFRKDVVDRFASQDPSQRMDKEARMELKKAEWEKLLSRYLLDVGKDRIAIERDPKGALWKIEIAKLMRKNSTASNPWLAEKLCMGHPSRVSNLICDSI